MAKPNILICDDEENLRKTLALILEKDYELLFAKDGQEAINQIKNQNVNLVLLDIKMPGLSGMDVLREIKSLKPSIKIIMITGYESTEIVREVIKQGATDYIIKPFSRKHVLKVVEEVLKK